MNLRFIFLLSSSLMLAACAVEVRPDASVTANTTMAPGAVGQASATQTSAAASVPEARAAARSPGRSPSDDKATGSLPEAQEVDVVAAGSMEGLWKVDAPSDVKVDLLGDSTYGKIRQEICRFDQHDKALRAICIPGRDQYKEGALSDQKLTLNWSDGMATAKFVGTLQSPVRFAGGYHVGLLGVGVTQDIPVSGVKIAPRQREGTNEDGAVWTIMSKPVVDAVVSEVLSPAAVTRLSKAPPVAAPERRSLGDLISATYVDSVEMAGDSGAPDRRLDVYEVEFANGWKMCGAVLDANGLVDDFQCR